MTRSSPSSLRHDGWRFAALIPIQHVRPDKQDLCVSSSPLRQIYRTLGRMESFRKVAQLCVMEWRPYYRPFFGLEALVLPLVSWCQFLERPLTRPIFTLTARLAPS